MRIIDADELIRKMRNDVPIKLFGSMKNLGNVIGIVEDAPTVDAVGVVRCKDCKHYIPRIKVPTDSGVFTVKICSRISRIGITNPEWYCAYGERADDGS